MTGVVDLRAVELKAQYSERFFPQLSDVGRELKGLIVNERRIVGLEVARYFVTGRRRFGRLGAEILWIGPESNFFAKVGLSTGILDGADSPWSVQLGLSYLFSFPRRGNDALAVTLETKRRLSDAADGPLALGGYLGWTYRLRTTLAPGDYEMMLVSFGPVLTWRGFRLAVSARLQLDKRIDAAGNGTNPSGLRLPDVSLAWGHPL